MGTVFNEVLIWTACGQQVNKRVMVAMTLKGHEVGYIRVTTCSQCHLIRESYFLLDSVTMVINFVQYLMIGVCVCGCYLVTIVTRMGK